MSNNEYDLKNKSSKKTKPKTKEEEKEEGGGEEEELDWSHSGKIYRITPAKRLKNFY